MQLVPDPAPAEFQNGALPAAFDALGLAFEEHDESVGDAAERMSIADLRTDMLGR